MMNSLRKIGLTPAKALVIGALGFGLVAVWGPQLSGLLGSGPSASPRKSRAARRPVVAKATVAAAETPQPAPEREVREFSVGDAAQHDPFVIPAWSPTHRLLAERAGAGATTPDEDATRFEMLRQAGLAMILVSESGAPTAQLGDQMLRVGDEIDGFRVTAIDARGVTFTPAANAEGGGALGL